MWPCRGSVASKRSPGQDGESTSRKAAASNPGHRAVDKDGSSNKNCFLLGQDCFRLFMSLQVLKEDKEAVHVLGRSPNADKAVRPTRAHIMTWHMWHVPASNSITLNNGEASCCRRCGGWMGLVQRRPETPQKNAVSWTVCDWLGSCSLPRARAKCREGLC